MPGKRDDFLSRIRAEMGAGRKGVSGRETQPLKESKTAVRRMTDESEMSVHQGTGRSHYGASEVSRRIPTMRHTGKSGEALEVVGTRKGDLVAMAKMTPQERKLERYGEFYYPRQYREPTERVVKKERVMAQEIKHAHKRGALETSIASRDITEQDRFMDISHHNIDMPELIKPNVNKEGIQKMDVISPAKPKVQGESGFRIWKELKVGEHIPMVDVPARLVLHPQPVKETYVKQKDVIKKKSVKTAPVEGRRMVFDEEMTSMREVEEPVRAEAPKAKRQPSAYNKFVSEKRREGLSMAEIAQMWRSRG